MAHLFQTKAIVKNKLSNIDMLKEGYFITDNPSIELNKPSYPILFRGDETNVLAECVFLGNNNFLSCIKKDLVKNIKIEPTSYYIQIENVNAFIKKIFSCSSTLENPNMILVVLNIKNDLKNEDIIDILDAKYILSYEQIGIDCNIITDYHNNETKTISLVEPNDIIVHTKDKINNGSPLLVNGILIGLFYRYKSGFASYLRLSSYLFWIGQFYTWTNNSNKIPNNFTKPFVKIPLSEEQLYYIINDLQNRLEILEKEKNDLMFKLS